MLSTSDATAARAILDDIDARNYKKALQAVEKRLRKSADPDYFKALQARVKCHIGQLSEKGTVLLQLEELVASKSIIKDVDTLQHYEEALDLILPKPGDSWARIIGFFRWALVKASPKDEEAGKNCFKACLAHQDYEHARLIANSLEKNFPGKRGYIFWNIVAMDLYSRCPVYPEKERKLYGQLAEGLMCKLAGATIQAAVSSPPIRCIRTPQELLLLDDILKRKSDGKKDADRLQFLQSPFLGPESTIAKGEWQLWRLKLELLEQQSEPAEIFQTTGDLLRRARTTEITGKIADSQFGDWLVWRLYVDAASSNKAKYKDQVEAEVASHLLSTYGVDKTWRRNASLARVRFSLMKAPGVEVEEDQMVEDVSKSETPESETLIMNYLKEYGDTSIAYTHLRPSVQKTRDSRLLLSKLLDQRRPEIEQGSFSISQDVSAGGIAKLVNTYKLIFLISSSIPEKKRCGTRELQKACERCSKQLSMAYCNSCLTELAWATIKSYGNVLNDDGRIKETLQKTDRHPADDLCVISALCLVKLSRKENYYTVLDPLESPSLYHLLQAAVLLEFAWTRSKSNSHICLLLTRLYTMLGCGSLAFRAFQRLSIKQIQHFSLSHYMFDGISSLHPHPFSSEDSAQQRSVIDEFRDMQNIYKNSTRGINKQIWKAFENNNYNPILELEEFKTSLAYNLSTIMSVIESRRVCRLTQPTIPLTASSCGYDILPFDVDDPHNRLFDTHDYDVLPNFEMIGVDSPLRQLPDGRMPFSSYRSHLDLFTEKVQTIIDPFPDAVSTTSARLWLNQNLDTVQEKINQAQIHEDKTQRNLDGFRYKLHYKIAAILVGRGKAEHLGDDLNTLLHMFSESEGSRSAPSLQGSLYFIYFTYEIGITVRRLVGYLGHTKASELFDLGERLIQAVRETASTVKKSFDEPDWTDKVLKSVYEGDPDVDDTSSIPGTLKNVVGHSFIDGWASEVVASWRDSIEGFKYFK